MRIAVLLVLLVAGVALPAASQPAQPPPPPEDVIGSLLDHRGQAPPKDEDEPDAAGQTPAAPEPEPQTSPSASSPASRPQLTEPVHVEDTGRTPDSPPKPRDLAYDSRIRASFASAEGFQGPLEGGWTLTANGSGDGDLYSLQLVDRADRLEGVWRDLRRKGSLNASGLVEDIQRQGQDLILRFTPAPGAARTVAMLHGGSDGRWTGELAEGDRKRPVVLRRSGP